MIFPSRLGIWLLIATLVPIKDRSNLSYFIYCKSLGFATFEVSVDAGPGRSFTRLSFYLHVLWVQLRLEIEEGEKVCVNPV